MVIALTVLAVLLLVAGIATVVLAARGGSLQRQLDHERSETRRRERNAVAKSRVAHVAKVTEQLAPLLPGFPDYNIKDVQWVGGAVDMIVWDGLEDGHDVNVVLLDIKTGRASVNARQRKIRDAVDAGRVRFEVVAFRPERAAAVPRLMDVVPGAVVSDEGLDVALIDAGDDNSDWEENIGDDVTFADDLPPIV